MNDKTNDWKEREIGGLWKAETQKTKKKYYRGNFNIDKLKNLTGKVKIVIFPNQFKQVDSSEGSNLPDLRIYLEAVNNTPNSKPAVAKPKPTSAKSEPQESLDDNDLLV